MSFHTLLDAHDAGTLSKSASATSSSTSNPVTSVPSLVGPEATGPAEGTQETTRPCYLDVPAKSSYRPRPSIDSTYSDLSELAIYSDELQRSRPLLTNATVRLPSASPAPARHGWRGTFSALWIRNKGVVLVLLAQAFGSIMNVSTRILETDGTHGKAMHPFQILFARQSLTSTFSLAYGYFAHVPNFPFGPRNLLPLLIARGLFGFFGVFGLYFALLYLPLAEATVLTFLGPIVSCYVCALLIPGESFSRQQQCAAFLSLVGVVVIARPASFFHSTTSSSDAPIQPTPPLTELAPNSTSTSSSSSSSSRAPFSDPSRPTAHQHLLAVMVSMIGVLGACGAMTAIRWIGTRAHPLISMNYFSVWSTLVSLLAVTFVPGVDFRFPANLVEWSLLASLGGCGYVMQFLLTAGLAYGGPSNENSNSNSSSSRTRRNDEERPQGKTMRESDKMKQGSGTRATNMVYTQMLFALAFDKLIWGITPGAASWAGSGLILGSAIWVAVARDKDYSKESAASAAVVVVGGDSTVVTHVKQRPRDDDRTAEEEQGLMGGSGVVEEGESSREDGLELEDLTPRQMQRQGEANESATLVDREVPVVPPGISKTRYREIDSNVDDFNVSDR